MNIIKDHIPKSRQKRPGTRMAPKKITIHSTANPKSTARNERGWLTNPSNNRSASWHLVVDDKEIIEAIPLNEVAYHSGTRAGNNTSIGIEMCESGDREKVIRNTIKLTTHLLKRFKLKETDVVRHYDWSGKNCPRILNYNGWQGWYEFKALLNIENQGGSQAMTNEKVKKIVKQVLKEEANKPQQAWANEAIDYVKKHGIMQGYDDGSFQANRYVTRAELAQVIYNLKLK